MESEPLFDIQITKDDTHLIPKITGIYFLYSDDRKLLYIGKSINIKMRVRNHLKAFVYKGDLLFNKKIFYIGIIKYPTDKLKDAELEMIDRYRPLLNIKDAHYINEVKILNSNNHHESSIKKCKHLNLLLENCNLYSLEDGYCHLHTPSQHHQPWSIKGKLVTSEMCRLLHEQPRHIVNKGMYFYMSKKTFNSFVKENMNLVIDIVGSDSYLRFRKHKIIIDDCHEIRITRYPILGKMGE